MAFLIPANLKSRRDVPEAVQRVARAFEMALDDDVTVWFEPLFAANDDKPDLVVLLPDRGIVVLEVLGARSAGVLGALRGRIRLERGGKEIEVANPLERADRLAALLAERVGAESRLDGVEVCIGSGAVFPHLGRDELAEKRIDKIVDPARSITQDEIDAAFAAESGTQLLRHLSALIGSSGEAPIPAELRDLLRGIIQPETVIDRVAGDSSKQLTIFRPQSADDGDSVRIMDRQQEAIAKSLGDGHRVIRGVAGSGKTLILTYRARLLAELLPHKPILVTCYTRSLAGHLREVLSDLPNVTVENLDRLMARVIRDAGLKHPGYSDKSGEAVVAVARQAMSRPGAPRYRAVLVDEAQDFATSALQLIVDLVEPGEEDLVIVADAAQNIFRRDFSWKDAGIKAQGRTRILRRNYRNTREILEFAHAFLLRDGSLRLDDAPDEGDENALIPPEAATRSGAEPRVCRESSVSAELDRVEQELRRLLPADPTPHSVAAVYVSQYADGSNIAAAIRDRLSDIGVFWLNDPSDRSARDRLAESKEPVVLSTVDAAKGLEFPGVVLFGLRWRADGLAELRKRAYVGMTRAMDHLAVVAASDSPLATDLQPSESALT